MLQAFSRNALSARGSVSRLLPALANSRGFSSSTAVVTPSETFKQKTLRWIDIGGTLSKWYSRRIWVMDMDPIGRASCIMVTEYERRSLIWLYWVTFGLAPIAIYLWWGEFTHLACKPMIGQKPNAPYLDNRKNDYTWVYGNNPLVASQCKDCRWLELECKKVCFDRLRDLGYSMWGLDRPRTQTFGTH